MEGCTTWHIGIYIKKASRKWWNMVKTKCPSLRPFQVLSTSFPSPLPSSIHESTSHLKEETSSAQWHVKTGPRRVNDSQSYWCVLICYDNLQQISKHSCDTPQQLVDTEDYIMHIALITLITNMEVSWNRGTPKSSISMVFSIINLCWGYHPLLGVPPF